MSSSLSDEDVGLPTPGPSRMCDTLQTRPREKALDINTQIIDLCTSSEDESSEGETQLEPSPHLATITHKKDEGLDWSPE